MKLHHNSSIPVREISTNRQIKYIYESDTSSSVGSLQGIQQAMQSASDYELVSITEFLPSNDPVKKHRVLDTLSELGLLVPCILLTYCPGKQHRKFTLCGKYLVMQILCSVYKIANPL